MHELQREFLDEIGDVLPGWLKRQRRAREARRAVEVELVVRERSALVLGWLDRRNEWRRRHLYVKACDDILRAHLPRLQKLYKVHLPRQL